MAEVNGVARGLHAWAEGYESNIRDPATDDCMFRAMALVQQQQQFQQYARSSQPSHLHRQ